MNLVFLSTMQWADADGAYAPTRLSIEFARRGQRVVFVQPFQPHAPPDTRGLPIRVLWLDELGLPGVVVTLAWRGVYSGPLADLASNLAAILAPMHAADPDAPRLAVLNAPFDPFVRLLPFLQAQGYWIIYYPQDDYAAMFDLGYFNYNPSQQAHLVERADRVFALSEPIAAKLSRLGRRVEIVPDAVDADEFRTNRNLPPPTAVLRGAECTLGFWGSIMDPMFDAELVRRVAQAKPQWAFNLIGAYDPAPQFASVYRRLEGIPNVRFHGRAPHGQLIQYAAAFDVCVLPAPDNDFSRGRDPLKVYEYLAAHKPVVVAHMPHLRAVPYVYVAFNADEFIRAVEGARATPVDPAVADAFLARQNWSARADGFLTHVDAMLTQTRGAPGWLDAAALESAGKAQPVGKLTANEWDGVVYYLQQWSKAATELPRVQAWARQLEAQSRAQQQHLDRFYRMLPLRLVRFLRKRD